MINIGRGYNSLFAIKTTKQELYDINNRPNLDQLKTVSMSRMMLFKANVPLCRFGTQEKYTDTKRHVAGTQEKYTGTDEYCGQGATLILHLGKGVDCEWRFSRLGSNGLELKTKIQ